MDLNQNEIPEIGGLADDYPEIGAAVGALKQSMLPVRLTLQQGAAGQGIGPATSATLAAQVAKHEQEIDQIQTQIQRVRLLPVKHGGAIGRGRGAQAETLSVNAPAGIALAAGATVAFVVTNNKGYAMDLARLRVQVTDPATALPASGVALTQIQINGDNYGDGLPVPVEVFDPQAQEPVTLNRRLESNGTVTGNLVNNTALPLVGRVTALVFRTGGVAVAGDLAD